VHERAKAYQIIEEHQAAVEDFSLVIKKNPKNAHAYFRRAFSLKALKVIFSRLPYRNTRRQQKISKRRRSWTH